jgi:probable addiction module antidote protein
MKPDKDDEADLLEGLKDPDFASEYLTQALATEDQGTFLLALHDVVDTQGGPGVLAKQLHIRRQSLYRVLSNRGNPTLATLRGVLKSIGLRIVVAPKAKAPGRRKKR